MSMIQADTVQQIIFMRHGIAVDRENFEGEDGDRPLTEEGIQKVHRVAKAMTRILRPNAIITSDYVRARATAAICMEAFLEGQDRSLPMIETADIRPGNTWQQWQKFLKSAHLPEVILVVGHEPNLSLLLSSHLQAPTSSVSFKKAGVSVIERSVGDSWVLRAFLPPKFWVAK